MISPTEFLSALRAAGVADQFHLALLGYVYDGRTPDLWLGGVLMSDVVLVSTGSPIQMENLKSIVACLEQYLEPGAWGSRQKCTNWCKAGGARGARQSLRSGVSFPDPGAVGPVPEQQWLVHHIIVHRDRLRPQHWPYRGPFWVVPADSNLSGRAAGAIAHDYPECVVIRAILPEGVHPSRVWPTQRAIVFSQYLLGQDLRAGTWFTTHFPCPEWWDEATCTCRGEEPVAAYG